LTENAAETPAAGGFSYDAMRATIEKNVPSEADREVLIAQMEHLKAVEGTDAFTSAYERFVQSAENHLPVLGPFIVRLSELLGG
jgi:hypothetical protein